MSHLLLRNATIIFERKVEHGSVLTSDGLIAGVFARGQEPVGLSASETLDIGGAYLAPGMIDIHIHGSAGVDVLEAGADDLATLSSFLLAEGVTGYFATLVPADEERCHCAISALTSHFERECEARSKGEPSMRAQLLGIHFEGPFVSEKKCGALRPEFFRIYDGDPHSIERFTAIDCPCLMTLAPEIKGGIELIADLVRAGARAFIGHTEADPETLDRAVEAGACHITHFPNALAPLHHRKPGAVAWGLVRGDVTLDSIADFQHVDPLMLRLIYQAKGADGMALISDAIPPTGLGDGEFAIWGETISVRNGRTSLNRSAGTATIAGSVITMRQALKNFISLGVSIEEAVRMASLVPARVVGMEGERGSIEKGKRADLIVFDEEFRVLSAISGGRVSSDQ